MLNTHTCDFKLYATFIVLCIFLLPFLILAGMQTRMFISVYVLSFLIWFCIMYIIVWANKHRFKSYYNEYGGSDTVISDGFERLSKYDKHILKCKYCGTYIVKNYEGYRGRVYNEYTWRYAYDESEIQDTIREVYLELKSKLRVTERKLSKIAPSDFNDKLLSKNENHQQYLNHKGSLEHKRDTLRNDIDTIEKLIDRDWLVEQHVPAKYESKEYIMCSNAC